MQISVPVATSMAQARTLPYGLTEFAKASEHATDVGAVAAALVLAQRFCTRLA